jgi:capsular polysaccharide biosynthesis protein
MTTTAALRHSEDEHDIDERTPVDRARTLGGALRRRWRVALAVAALTSLTGLALSLMAPKKYDATAKILLQPTDAVRLAVAPNSLPSPANAQRDVETNAQLITAREVLQSVKRAAHLSLPLATIADEISVAGQESTNIVSITARDADPKRAAAIATTFARAYRAYRQRMARGAIRRAINSGRSQLATVADRGERRQLKLRVEQLKTSYAVETGGVQIVSQAKVPAFAASPRPMTSALLAGMGGILLAIAAAIASDRLDRRLLEPAGVSAALGAPVLAELDARRRRGGDADPYVELATRLVLSGRGGPTPTIMVSSCDRDGSTAAAVAALTARISASGRRVLVIEANVRRPRNSGAGVYAGGRGLAGVLEGKSTFESELTDVHIVSEHSDGSSTQVSSYTVLPAGIEGSDAAALLARPALRDVLSEARARADVVLVEGAPVLPVSEWAPVAQACDGVLLFAARPTHSEAAEVRRAFEDFGVNVIGVVMAGRGATAEEEPAAIGEAELDDDSARSRTEPAAARPRRLRWMQS